MRLDVAGFGQAQQTLIVTRPLRLDLMLPEQLRAGDAVEVAARVQNTGAVSQTVRVLLTATGLHMRAEVPLAQDITLAPNASDIVRWSATVGNASVASLNVRAQANTRDEISVTQKLPIELPGVTQSEGGVLAQEQANITLDLGGQQEGAQLVVEAAPSLAALARGTLQSLAANPRHSTLDDASMLVIADVVSGTNALARPALDRLLAAQKLDGTWGWWPDSPSDTFVTASALEALAAARQTGLPVPQDAVRRGLDALRPTADASPALRALVEYVRALHGRADQATITALASDSAVLGNEGVAYLLLAGASGDARDALLARLSEQPLRDARGAFWAAGSAPDLLSTRASTTALAALALQKAYSGGALLPAAQAWLAAVRSPAGWDDGWSWSSVRALAALRSLTASATDATVMLNGAPLLSFDSSDVITTTRQITVSSEGLRPRNTITTSGGPVFLSYRLLVPGTPTAQQENVGVLREYLDPQTGMPLDLSSVQSGQLVRIRLTFVTHRALRFATLQDVLPGGMRLVSAGKGDWEHVASIGNQLLLARTALPAGIYEHNYLARATAAGTFGAPPVVVSASGTTLTVGRATTMIVVPQ